MSEEGFLPQLFKCHGCIEMCSSPVALCVNGHHICYACVKTQAECPMCRVPGTPIRNVAGDGLVAQVLAPPNGNIAEDALGAQVLTLPAVTIAMDGLVAQVLAPPGGNIADTLVAQVVAPDDTLQRQGVKRKRPEDLDAIYNCEICDNYPFSGTRSALYHHVKTAEAGNVEFMEGRTITVFRYPLVSEWCVSILKWDKEEEYFWVHCKYDVISGKFYFYARYIGPDEKAGNFKLKWRISTKDEETAVICFVRELLSEKEHFLNSDKTIVLSETCFDITPRVGREFRYGIESIMRT